MIDLDRLLVEILAGDHHHEGSNQYDAVDGKVVYPTAIQVRFAGCKGVLQVKRGLKEQMGVDILIFRSMMKAPVDLVSSSSTITPPPPPSPSTSRSSPLTEFGTSTIVHVCRTARRYTCFLNHQIILLLSARGVANDVLVSMMQRELLRVYGSLLCNVQTLNEHAHLFRGPFFPPSFLANFTPSMANHYFFRCLAAHCVRYHSEELRRRGCIHIRKGAVVLGTTDLTQTLGPGEVFINLSADEQAEHEGVLEGHVLVTRNPCYHPGDVRVLRAVNTSNSHLRELKDQIVFPSRSDCRRPHADEMGGGDVDGDLFHVIWDPQLVQPLLYPSPQLCRYIAVEEGLGNVEAMNYQAPQVQHLPVDEEDYFVRTISNFDLGRLSNLHKLYADLKGAYCQECLLLATLCSYAVDAPKTGVKVRVPQHLKLSAAMRPEWSIEDDDERRRSFKPPTLLQQLADCVQDVELRLAPSFEQCTGLPDHLPPPIKELKTKIEDVAHIEWCQLEERACRLLKLYQHRLSALIRRFGLSSEAEAISCKIMYHRNSSSQDRWEHTNALRQAIRRLREEVVSWWKIEVGSEQAQAAAGCLSPDITATMVVCCVWQWVSHVRPVSDVDLQITHQPVFFVSFGWVACDALQQLLDFDLEVPMGQNPLTEYESIGQRIVDSLTREQAVRMTHPYSHVRLQRCLEWCVPVALFVQRIYEDITVEAPGHATACLADLWSQAHVLPESNPWPASHPAAHFIFEMAKELMGPEETSGTRRDQKLDFVRECWGMDFLWDRMRKAAYNQADRVARCVLRAAERSPAFLQQTFVVAVGIIAFSPDLRHELPNKTRQVVPLGHWQCSRFVVTDTQAILHQLAPSVLVADRCENADRKECRDCKTKTCKNREVNVMLEVRPTKIGGLVDMVALGDANERQLRELSVQAIRLLEQGFRREQLLENRPCYQAASCRLEPEMQKQIIDCVQEHTVTLVVSLPLTSTNACVHIFIHAYIHHH